MRYSGRKDDRTPNAPFAPDGEMWSSVQEWWNNNKQGIQQSIKLYGESLATSSAFVLFMQSKEQQNSGNTDLSKLDKQVAPSVVSSETYTPKVPKITDLRGTFINYGGTINYVINDNINTKFWSNISGRGGHNFPALDISAKPGENPSLEFYGPNQKFKILYAGPIEGFGGTIVIKTDDGTVFRMGHFTEINNSVKNATVNKDWLEAGSYLGATREKIGFSSGPHLHIEGYDSEDKFNKRLKLSSDKIMNGLR